MSGNVFQWFYDYLSDRYQYVSYQNSVSSKLKNDYGVPQGSVLGPLLFILFINDLNQITDKCKIKMFADDTIIYWHDNDTKKLVEVLNEELKLVHDWLNENGLKLNIKKTKSMLISTTFNKVNKKEFKINIDNENIECVKMHKYLGIVLDEHLNFKDHMKYVVRKINKKVNYLGRIGQDLTKWCKRTIYKTIIEPHLTYCSSLLLILNESDIQNLQMVQNRALRIILSTNRYASVRKISSSVLNR